MEKMDVAKSSAHLSAIHLRPDGRMPDEFRSTSFKLNVMKNADGSCLYEQGNAKVGCMI